MSNKYADPTSLTKGQKFCLEGDEEEYEFVELLNGRIYYGYCSGPEVLLSNNANEVNIIVSQQPKPQNRFFKLTGNMLYFGGELVTVKDVADGDKDNEVIVKLELK